MESGRYTPCNHLQVVLVAESIVYSQLFWIREYGEFKLATPTITIGFVVRHHIKYNYHPQLLGFIPVSDTHAPHRHRYAIVLARPLLHTGAVPVAQANTAVDCGLGDSVHHSPVLRHREQQSIKLCLFRDDVSIYLIVLFREVLPGSLLVVALQSFDQ